MRPAEQLREAARSVPRLPPIDAGLELAQARSRPSGAARLSVALHSSPAKNRPTGSPLSRPSPRMETCTAGVPLIIAARACARIGRGGAGFTEARGAALGPRRARRTPPYAPSRAPRFLLDGTKRDRSRSRSAREDDGSPLRCRHSRQRCSLRLLLATSRLPRARPRAFSPFRICRDGVRRLAYSQVAGRVLRLLSALRPRHRRRQDRTTLPSLEGRVQASSAGRGRASSPDEEAVRAHRLRHVGMPHDWTCKPDLRQATAVPRPRRVEQSACGRGASHALPANAVRSVVAMLGPSRIHRPVDQDVAGLSAVRTLLDTSRPVRARGDGSIRAGTAPLRRSQTRAISKIHAPCRRAPHRAGGPRGSSRRPPGASHRPPGGGAR
jgi:hypothetical protein